MKDKTRQEVSMLVINKEERVEVMELERGGMEKDRQGGDETMIKIWKEGKNEHDRNHNVRCTQPS